MEELVFNFDESEEPKAKQKDIITYEPVEKGIQTEAERLKGNPPEDILIEYKQQTSRSFNAFVIIPGMSQKVIV